MKVKVPVAVGEWVRVKVALKVADGVGEEL